MLGEAIVYRLKMLTPGRMVALLSISLILLVIAEAQLVSEATFRLLSTVDVAEVRLAVLVTAALVAIPVLWALVGTTVSIQEGRRNLKVRDELLSTAQGYAKLGHWEFEVANGRFILSDALHHLLGDPDKTLRLTVPELLEMANPEDRERVAAAMKRVLVEGSHEQIEYRITGLDGKERAFWVTAARLLGPDGKPLKVFGISQDITEHKAIEAALRESEDHYRHAVELSPAMPWVEDAEGNTLEVSNRWFELTGLSVEASLGKGWTETLHPDDLEATESIWQQALRTGEPYDVEHRVRVADGSYRWFRSRAAARRTEGGEIARWYGSVEDIHARKAAEIALQESEAALRESEDHYRHTVELSPHIPWTADPQGRTLEVLSKWEVLTGLSREEGLGTGWIKVLHPEDVEETLRAWEKPLKTGEPYSIEHRLRLADGTYRWFWVRASARRDCEGNIVRWYGTTEDIHDRKLAEIALRESEAFASSILDGTSDCIDVIDLNGRLQFMNSSCRKLMKAYGYSFFIGQHWLELWPDNLKPQVSEAFETARTGLTARFNCSGLTTNNEMGFWDVSISPILGPSGQPERLLCVSRDITAIKSAQNELEQAREAAEVAARHDGLTGLLNRSAFRKQLEQATCESQAAVLFLDLDEFKSVNDSLGHPAGDELLRQVGGRLRTCLRASDQIARFGGDEFAIFRTSVNGPEPLERQASRVIDALKEPYLLEGREVVVGVSIGIAVADMTEVEADDLLKRADIALYEAKQAGKGVYRFFVPGMDEAAEELQRLRSEFRDAVTRGEFRILYQPVVELETSRVTSFEALLRWQHPRRGLLNPVEFISLAEETGDIAEIGDWILGEACAMAATWPHGISVSVNLSSRQLRGACLIKAVSQALAASGLPAHRLMLEITESVLLQDDKAVRDILQGLRVLGVRISIDDFGTGYSSLGYLLRFSVDNIKIDRSFVAELSENPRASAVLSALVTLSQDLGVSLTAEGIETVTHLKELKAMGCGHGQGFFFSRPMPDDAITVFLANDWASPMAQMFAEGGEEALGKAELAIKEVLSARGPSPDVPS